MSSISFNANVITDLHVIRVSYPFSFNSYGGVKTVPNDYNADIYEMDVDDIITNVKTILKSILFTQTNSVPMNRDSGTKFSELVFEPIDGGLMSISIMLAYEAIKRFEPRVKVKQRDITLKSDEEYVYVTVRCKVSTSNEPINIEFREPKRAD